MKIRFGKKLILNSGKTYWSYLYIGKWFYCGIQITETAWNRYVVKKKPILTKKNYK